MNKQNMKWLDRNRDFFLGSFEMVDENLPDGAYLQMRIDSADHLLNTWMDIGMEKPPKNLEGYDISMGLMRAENGEYAYSVKDDN